MGIEVDRYVEFLRLPQTGKPRTGRNDRLLGFDAGLAPLVDLPGGDAVVRLDLALGEQGDEASREGDAALTLRSLHQTLTFLRLKLNLRG